MKGIADFYNSTVFVSGALDRIFYTELFRSLNFAIETKDVDARKQAILLLKKGIKIDSESVQEKGADVNVLNECAKYNESDRVIGIIDFDDGINYYSKYAGCLKRDLPSHIAYTDGADIESMVTYYEPALLEKVLMYLTNDKKVIVQDTIRLSKEASAKLRMLRATVLSIPDSANRNIDKYVIPGTNLEVSRDELMGFYVGKLKIENQSKNSVSKLFIDSKIDFDRWIDFNLTSNKLKLNRIEYDTDEQLIAARRRHYAPLISFAKTEYETVEDKHFFASLDETSRKLCKASIDKKLSYQMRGHDMEPILWALTDKDIELASFDIVQMKYDLDRYRLYKPGQGKIKGMDFVVLYSDPNKLINSPEFQQSELYKRIMKFIDKCQRY